MCLPCKLQDQTSTGETHSAISTVSVLAGARCFFSLPTRLLLPYHPFHSSYPNISQRRFPDIPISTLSTHLSISLQSSFRFLLVRPFLFSYVHTYPSSWKVGYPSSTTTPFVFGHLTGFCPHNPFPFPSFSTPPPPRALPYASFYRLEC